MRQPAELQGTQRDNQVELMFGSDVTSLDFRFHDGKATAKGAMHGVIKDLQDDRLVLHVYSERKGSEEMANEWFDRLGRDDHRMVGADVIDVHMDDWMYQMNQHVLLNRTDMSKLGIHLAGLFIAFHKP